VSDKFALIAAGQAGPRPDPDAPCPAPPLGTQLGGLRPQPQPTLKLAQMRPQHLEPTRQRLRQIRHNTTVAALSPETGLIHREPLAPQQGA
jgi:hypothetical protein